MPPRWAQSTLRGAPGARDRAPVEVVGGGAGDAEGNRDLAEGAVLHRVQPEGRPGARIEVADELAAVQLVVPVAAVVRAGPGQRGDQVIVWGALNT